MRLHVDHRQSGTVFVQILIGDPLDVNFEQANHRQIFRTRDLSESYDRRSGPVTAEELAQSQSAADCVRVRIMLQQNMDLFALAQK